MLQDMHFRNTLTERATNMWLTNKETGGHFNTDWVDKDKQIADNKKEADERNGTQLADAIKAYSAKGGQYASKYPFSAEKKSLLEKELSNSNYKTSQEIYRGINVSEKQWEEMFYKMYDGKDLEVNLSGLQSFTKERSRAFGYGSGGQKIIYRVEKGTTLHGQDISDRSIYPEEKEVLLANNKMKATYKDIEFMDNGTVILTIHPDKRGN